MSTEAINTWRQITKPRIQQSPGGSKSQRLPSNTTGGNVEPRSNTRLTRRRRPHSHWTNSTDSDENRNIRELEGVGLSADPSSSHPKSHLLIRISQHSSFERDQYLQYHSSLSVHSILSSLPPHQDSGLGESSPPPEASELDYSPRVGIVQDSQSIPGSSSYVPTSSVSDTSIGVSSDSGRLESTYISTSFDQETGLLTEDEDLHNDQTEGSSGFYVAESPEYTSRFRRSRSVPI